MTGSEFVTWVNGKEYRIPPGELNTEQTVLQFVRSIGLTGSKLGCGEGGCGACTILLSTVDASSGYIHHETRNACLLPLPSTHERHILTVEGLGNVARPHLVQKLMADDASQCGFCTPGFVMSLYGAFRNGQLKESNIEDFLDGNLCRCTGYRPIVDAARAVCAMGENCCRIRKEKEIICVKGEGVGSLQSQFDPSQEIIFPPKLKQSIMKEGRRMAFFSGRVTWYRPVTLDGLVDLKRTHPDAKLVAGNTEIGVEVKLKNQFYPTLISVADISELDFIKELEEGIEIGSGVNLTRLKDFSEEHREGKYGGMELVYEMLRWFAGTQIRNAAGWAGNVATASPISDLNPVWCALGAHLVVLNFEGTRRLPLKTFFLGYRKTALAPNEVIKSIIIPWKKPTEFMAAYKQSKRRSDDIAIVNAAFRVELDSNHTVTACSISFGGMGPTTLISQAATLTLVGKQWTSDTFIEEACAALQDEFTLSSDAVGGMPEYRNSLVVSFFFKFYLTVCSKLGMVLDTRHESILLPRTCAPLQSTQYFPPVDKGICTGQPIPHLSALKHSTGIAQYVDDLPPLKGELYAGLLLSSHSHAKILSIDTSAAMNVPGVESIITYEDVPSKGTNRIGPVINDENIFVQDVVTSCGQIIAIVIASDQAIAQGASKLIKVDYEDLPAIYTIDEAINQNSYHPFERKLNVGDPEKAIHEAPFKVSGTAYIGGQEHFYLETQAALVIPKAEDGEFEIFSSTQNPTEGQTHVSHVLGIPSNKVTCKVKRIGGGFGGKETRSSVLIAAIAVAANKVGRPVRCMLDRDEDMIFSGQRHPFKVEYSAGMDAEGKLVGADLRLFSNGGHSLDLSGGVLERAMTHIDNSYYFPTFRVIGHVCKTNLPSNTAFRGFGAPQGNFFCETIIEHLAQVSNLDAHSIRKSNLYKDGLMTPFRATLTDVPLELMWDELSKEAEYTRRHEECIKFNKNNRWTKRGISMIPTKFGISFHVPFLNQAGALVHIYKDGTVLLTHGGVEMGQGVHTKMCQIAAETLGISMNQIQNTETSTATIPNTSPSAASASSDLNGMAVKRACEILNERLAPIKESLASTATFPEIAQRAYHERVDLSARGFYATPDLNFDWNQQTGRLYNYFTYGVSISEVEVDILTGDHQVLRTDILMDLGRALNPMIDIGQIEGAFTQGLGLFTIEQPLFLRNGMMLNRGPGGYKIPTSTDAPRILNVSLLPDRINPFAVRSSKAVGEPPLFLAASILFAIQVAVRDARLEAHCKVPLVMDSPATAERIRMAAADLFVAPDGDPIDIRSNKQVWCFEA